MGRLFGTDGARGVANAELTPELAMNIGRAAAMVLISDEVEHPTILIGKSCNKCALEHIARKSCVLTD